MNANTERKAGGKAPALVLQLLVVLSLVGILPLALAGLLVTLNVEKLYRRAETISRTHERRARQIADGVTQLLRQAERDLLELSRLPQDAQTYTEFARRHTRTVWQPAADTAGGQTRFQAPLYREVAFADAQGREVILVVRGQPAEPSALRDVSRPEGTTFGAENYFAEARAAGPGKIYVSHLVGFHVNRIEALGIEKLILAQGSARERVIYRYLLHQLLQEAGVLEQSGSFQEGEHTILIYRRRGQQQRILVEMPDGMEEAELRAKKQELKEFIESLAPEDTGIDRPYDGVIRLATAVADGQGNFRGVVSLALEHTHLQQLTQHVKAMELDAVPFAGYRDADYTFLVDDEGWIITHPKIWNIRGVDYTGKPLPTYTPESSTASWLAGSLPLNLEQMDWKLGEGYHQVIDELRRGRTGLLTASNLGGVMRTQIYYPIFYDTGEYRRHGIFGGVLMGTRADVFIQLTQKLSDNISRQVRNLERLIFIILALTLVLVVVLGLLTARNLARPIHALTQAAGQMATGDLQAKVPESGPREVRQLGAALRHLAERLCESISELEAKNAQLRVTQKKLLEAERLERQRLEKQVEALQAEVARASFSGMIAASPAMKKIQEEIVRVAASSATVLILGENGTGKELVAQAIHLNSPRRQGEFVKVNCAAFNDNLLESELFGHVKGAFTGADRERRGLFEVAHGGTLLLDEVGDMSPNMQKKLLRVLQEGELVPVGGSQVKKVDVRVIAATNRDLSALMKEGLFREDLYHRLNVIRIEIPPLRERREDILPLAQAFLRRFCTREGKGLMQFSAEAEKFLLEYPWPGNVRELENAIERAVIRSLDQFIRPEDFQLRPAEEVLPPEAQDKVLTLEELERAYILKVLEANGGNKKLTAQQLGIGYNTLWRKLKQYGRV